MMVLISYVPYHSHGEGYHMLMSSNGESFRSLEQKRAQALYQVPSARNSLN